MKKYAVRFLSLCLMLCMLLGSANAYSFSYDETFYEFGFHIDDEGSAWAEWQRRTNGVNFRVKIHNYSPSEYVDSFTLAISARDVYDDPIMLKASDGCWYDTLWYTSDISYKPGRVAMSEYFYVQGDANIRSITATVVQYHVKGEGTVEIDPYDYDSRTWTLK